MNGVYLTAAELNALRGSGPLGISAYLWLRACMDLASGIVGLARSISYQMLLEDTETHVPRGQGCQIVKVTLKELRCALDRLERAGLIRRVGNREKLVFKLPMSKTLPLAQNEQGTVRADRDGSGKGIEQGSNPGREQGIAEANDGAEFRPEHGTEHGTEPGMEQGTSQGRGKTGEQGIHQRSGIKASTSQAAYTAVNGVGVEDAAAALRSAKRVDREAEPDEDLSRRAVALAVAVRQMGGNVTASDPKVRQWAAQAVTEAQIAEAMRRAKARREEEGSAQAIGAGFLDALLRDVLNPPKPKAPPWWASVSAMEAKAREVGIAGARPGEEMDAFKARITAAIRRVEGGAA